MPYTSISRPTDVKVADEVWIATALLHLENPQRSDFTVSEIVERAEKEAIAGRLRPGVRVHVLLHCVANLPPNPGRYRMLYATGKHTRRLFRRGDSYSHDREGSKVVPSKDEIPTKYHHLLQWYEGEYVSRAGGATIADALLSLRGSGKQLWASEHADEYVRRLREGWE